jgi:hypothetical protein
MVHGRSAHGARRRSHERERQRERERSRDIQQQHEFDRQISASLGAEMEKEHERASGPAPSVAPYWGGDSLENAGRFDSTLWRRQYLARFRSTSPKSDNSDIALVPETWKGFGTDPRPLK